MSDPVRGPARLVVATLLVAVGFTGCSSDDDAPASEGPDTPASAAPGATDETSGSDSSDDRGGTDGDGSAPTDASIDDFPIPAPDGLLLDAFADAGVPQANQRHLFYDDGDFDRVVAFYDEWTSQDGGEWVRSEAAGAVLYRLVDETGLQQIQVEPGFDPGAQADGPVTSVQLLTS